MNPLFRAHNTQILSLGGTSWVPDTTICESENAFAISKIITGLSSPYQLWYDPSVNLTYVGDFDDAAGNIYWFNPDTATSPADMTHSTTVNLRDIYNAWIDEDLRRIYMVGKNTGGLIAYDIATDTITTVAFGADGVNFSRLSLFVGANKIYCSNGTSTLIIIDRATLTITSTLDITVDIPGPPYFARGAYTFQVVGTELWVCGGTGNDVGNIGVYDELLTTNIDNIVLPGKVVFESRYWQTSFYDIDNNLYHVGDVGSSRYYVIDGTTRSIVFQRLIVNKEGKPYVIIGWALSSTSGKLYIGLGMIFSSSDVPIQRMYEMDRLTFEYKNMYENQYYIPLKNITGTPVSMGADHGLPAWVGGPWATDGTITFVTDSGGNNTGIINVLTLKEIDDITSLPTGTTKPNSIDDPDYISPFLDTDTCPIAYNLACFTNSNTTFTDPELYYEFVLPPSVRTNPLIVALRITPYRTDAGLPLGDPPIIISAPFTNNFFSGSFATVSSGDATNLIIQVEYLDIDDVVLATCLSQIEPG